MLKSCDNEFRYSFCADLPITWEKPVDTYREPKVTKGTTEWKDVESEFFKTLGRRNAAILEVSVKLHGPIGT